MCLYIIYLLFKYKIISQLPANIFYIYYGLYYSVNMCVCVCA